MKRFYMILLLISCSFVMFFLCGCSKTDETYKLTTDEQVVIYGERTSLPTIKLNNKIISWNEFCYENEDEYIYVYNGKICLSETAPDGFETELKIFYKNNYDVNTTVLVNKPYIPITSVNIEITNQRIYPGEYVYYNVNYQPQNAILKNYTVEFDKPEYIESQGSGKFKLKDTTPLNEKIKIVIMTDNNISNEQEITVDNTVYEVYNVAQLRRMANDPYGYFKIMKDIDFSDTQWSPISDFYGVLNGDGYNIIGLQYLLKNHEQYIVNDTDFKCFGLVARLSGLIKNITFTNACFVVNSSNGNEGKGFIYVGIVAGRVESGSVIENVKIYSSTVSVERDRSEYGGIAGVCDGIISNCNIYGINLFGNGDEGGIVGGLCGIVKNCNVYGNINGGKSSITYYATNGARGCGGIAGYVNCGTIKECNIYDTSFELQGGYDKYPNMGYIVGKQKSGKISHVGADLDTCSYSPKDDFLITLNNIVIVDFKKHFFYQGWGFAGMLIDSPIIE